MSHYWKLGSVRGLLGYLYAFCMPSLAGLEKSSSIVEVEYYHQFEGKPRILHMMYYRFNSSQ